MPWQVMQTSCIISGVALIDIKWYLGRYMKLMPHLYSLQHAERTFWKLLRGSRRSLGSNDGCTSA